MSTVCRGADCVHTVSVVIQDSIALGMIVVAVTGLWM